MKDKSNYALIADTIRRCPSSKLKTCITEDLYTIFKTDPDFDAKLFAVACGNDVKWICDMVDRHETD